MWKPLQTIGVTDRLDVLKYCIILILVKLSPVDSSLQR